MAMSGPNVPYRVSKCQIKVLCWICLNLVKDFFYWTEEFAAELWVYESSGAVTMTQQSHLLACLRVVLRTCICIQSWKMFYFLYVWISQSLGTIEFPENIFHVIVALMFTHSLLNKKMFGIDFVEWHHIQVLRTFNIAVVFGSDFTLNLHPLWLASPLFGGAGFRFNFRIKIWPKCSIIQRRSILQKIKFNGQYFTLHGGVGWNMWPTRR